MSIEYQNKLNFVNMILKKIFSGILLLELLYY